LSQHQSRLWGLRDGKAAAPAAVVGARVIVAAHVARQAEILGALGARDTDAAAAVPDFRPAKVVEDLRAGIARSTTLKDSRDTTPARVVVVIAPPQRPFRTGLEDVGDVAGLSETDVELAHLARNDRVGAVPDDFAVFVLVETQQDEILLIATGLGPSIPDYTLDLMGDRVGCPRVVSSRPPAAGHHVPHPSPAA